MTLCKLNMSSTWAATDDDSLVSWWHRTNSSMGKEKAKSWRSILALVWWNLWKERNDRTFRNISCHPTQLFLKIQVEAKDWVDAGRKRAMALVERPLEPD